MLLEGPKSTMLLEVPLPPPKKKHTHTHIWRGPPRGTDAAEPKPAEELLVALGHLNPDLRELVRKQLIAHDGLRPRLRCAVCRYTLFFVDSQGSQEKTQPFWGVPQRRHTQMPDSSILALRPW